jgi:peptide/nickel transport system substrate-binding protein
MRNKLSLLFVLIFTLTTFVVSAQDKGGTLIVQGSGDPRSFNGLYANDGNSLLVLTFVVEPLILGGENWGDSIEPALAESWDVSEDGLEYTFNLRQDVTWHDGQPFTAEDVLFTYQAVLLEENATPWRNNLIQNGTPFEFEVVDDHTFKVILSQVDATVLTALAIPIIPAHAFTDLNIIDAPFNTNPIGTGPFKFVEWNSGANVILEAHDTYWRGEPKLDRIVVSFIEGVDNAANALLAGDLDFARIDGADLPPFIDNPDFVIVEQPRDLQRYVGFNTLSPITGDPALRRALATGLDRQAVIDAVAGGYGLLSDSVFNRTVFAYEEGRNPQYAYDPEAARTQLADLGWTDSDSNGFLDRDGQELAITLVYSGTWSLLQNIAPIVYDNWRSLGVNVTLLPLDDAAVYEAIYDNVSAEKPYDAFLGGWGLYGPEPDHYKGQYASETGFLAYDNPEVTALFNEGRITTDPEARLAIYAEADALLWQDLPIIPIFQPIGVYVFSSQVNVDNAEINGTFLTGIKYAGEVYFE